MSWKLTTRRLVVAIVMSGAGFVGWPGASQAQTPAGPPVGANPRRTTQVDMTAEVLDELRAVRKELAELRRSDAEKTRKIEGLQRRVEELQAASLVPPKRSDAASSRARGESSPAASHGNPRVRQASAQTQTPQPSAPARDQAVKELQPQESPLDRALQELQQQEGQSPLDRAVQGLQAPQGQAPLASVPVGPGQLQLMDISLDILTDFGTSTEREESIRELEGGDHDPHKRGFAVPNVELFLQGAVDPYFDAAAALVEFINPAGETIVELEEANFTTRSLPYGLQLKAGQYFTEFGRNNPQHPHAWHWIDQPIINSRVFGPDAMRGPGARLSWLVPVNWFSEVYGGVQNANGETMASFLASNAFFEERAIAGRPFVDRDVRSLEDLLYYFRWENSWTDCTEETTWLLGFSGAFGPNATGPDGNTQVYGADLTMKWKPAKNERGWPFVIWENEFTARRYAADNFSDDVVLAGERLHDWGFYTQLLYGFKIRWAAGLRYEFAGGDGDSLDADFNPISRNDDPFRDDRHRLSPLLAWYPTEFSRFRLQYNYDHAEHRDSKDAHSFWASAEVLFGAHPAHRF